MNKLGLFLCFLLAISYTQSEVIDGLDINELYDKFTIIAKGMAETTEYKCANSLINNKAKILPEVENIMKSLNNEQELMSKLIGAGLKLFMIDGFATDCNLQSIMEIAPKITKAEGIRNMGNNMINNADELETIFKEFTNASDLDGKLIVIGKIIRKITGISFK